MAAGLLQPTNIPEDSVVIVDNLLATKFEMEFSTEFYLGPSFVNCGSISIIGKE